MKRTINLLIIGLNSLSIVAQEQWTMNRCISYAIEHANSVRKQRIEIRQSRYDMTMAGLDFLPTISAQLSGQYSWGVLGRRCGFSTADEHLMLFVRPGLLDSIVKRPCKRRLTIRLSW